jgi:hypothetical protein
MWSSNSALPSRLRNRVTGTVLVAHVSLGVPSSFSRLKLDAVNVTGMGPLGVRDSL